MPGRTGQDVFCSGYSHHSVYFLHHPVKGGHFHYSTISDTGNRGTVLWRVEVVTGGEMLKCSPLVHQTVSFLWANLVRNRGRGTSKRDLVYNVS